MSTSNSNKNNHSSKFNLAGLWHGSVEMQEFLEFDCRGIGVHIGTYEQAKSAIEDLHKTKGRLIRVNARVLNPIRLPDMGDAWSSPIRMITVIAQAMGSASATRGEWDIDKYDNIHKKINDEWNAAYLIADKQVVKMKAFDDFTQIKHECASRLVLQLNGFDGIIYANQYEGVLNKDDDSLLATPDKTSGDSYIVFTNEQIKIVRVYKD